MSLSVPSAKCSALATLPYVLQRKRQHEVFKCSFGGGGTVPSFDDHVLPTICFLKSNLSHEMKW